jgi:multiple sugar transport system substrate-binding protein
MSDTTRRTFLAGAAGLGIASLSACGSGGGGERPPIPDEIPTDTKAKINYSIWDRAQEPAMRKIVAAFNKTYPDITVNVGVTPFAQYFTKLQTQATGNDLPDVFWMNGPHIEMYASYGKLQDMAEVPGFDPSPYPDAMNELYTVDGKQWAIPKDFDTIGLWYNQEILHRAGVDDPDDSWTWDTYREAASVITKGMGGENVWGTGGGIDGQAVVYPMMYQSDAYVVSEDKKTSGFDLPGSVDTFTFLREMVDDGAAPTPAFNAENTAQDLFGSGKAGMVWDGNWSAAVFKDTAVAKHARTAPLPKGKKQTNVIHGIGNVMSPFGKNKPAAAAFLAFLGSKEANLIQAQEGAANPAYQAVGDAYLDALPDYDLSIFQEAASDAIAYPTSINTDGWQHQEENYKPRIVGGSISVEKGLKQLADQMNEVLKNEQ